jgi:hypothetical protein
VTRPAHVIAADLAANSARRAELETELAHALLAGATAAPARPANDAPAYFTTAEAAVMLGVSTRHLAALRAEGQGPVFARIGRSVRYSRIALESYDARPRTVRSPFACDGVLPFGVHPALQSR